MRAAVLSILAGLLAAGPAPSQERKIAFDRDVRPILSDACFACHGPDEANRMAGLRLDRREDALRVVEPGSAERSKLFQRVNHEAEVARMPPPAFPRKLSAEQVETLRLWIEQGAEWRTHWAYEPVQRPALPSVTRKDWVRNPIDRFVLSRLESAGLGPSPEADRATLLRRVSFDLTGLPPVPEEIDAFVADSAPDAYERVVERLLASPRHGERMAVRWLDLARYADTHGFHIDSHRDMWPWRDWVIDAYNRNMPFDRFTVEQLAGDLLPAPTVDQLVATGFNRNHMINFEGGAIPEEYHVEYVVDRVETTSTVWMGMTMGCARCHDHKYDPIPQRDFYRFFAFFNTIDEKGLDGTQGNATPVLRLPDAIHNAKLRDARERLRRAEAALPEAELTLEQIAWEADALAQVPAPPERGLLARYGFDRELGDGRLERGEIDYPAGKLGRALSMDGEQQVALGAALDLARPFGVAFWSKTGAQKGVTFLKQGGLEAGIGLATKVEGEYQTEAPFEVLLGGRLWRTRERFTTRVWHHLTVSVADPGRLEMFVDGRPAETESEPAPALAAGSGALEIGAKDSVYQGFEGEIDELRLYTRPLDAAEAEALAVHHPNRAILERADRTCDDEDALRDYFRSHFARPDRRTAYAEAKRLEREIARLERDAPTTMVMREMADPRTTYILARGDYAAKTDPVTAGTPSALAPLPAGAKADRLALARWLVSGEHPLTARVAVNRDWEMYFGTGLVRTTEDFGSQGEAPSHPELLDWLAAEFVESGWDVRHMQRLIVTSATYRQSSRMRPELLEADPENRLLARGPRFRLPAEMVRDNALAVAGLLSPKVGGPSVNPYQPPGIWEDVSYGDRFTAQTYRQDAGEALYRRSMYTFWKRTAPPPALTTFDAPDREKCTVRRARTNTPLQALTLMNDPTYVEAARALASRALDEAADSDAARLERAYRLALGRAPNANERDALLTLLAAERAEYRANPAAARALLAVGELPLDPRRDPAELAAWTLAASAILNLDETMTKE